MSRMKFLIGQLRALFTHFPIYSMKMQKAVKCSFVQPHIPQVRKPDEKVVQQWNKFFIIFCVFAIFLDTLFAFLQYVMQDNKCVTFNWPMMKALLFLRSMTDFIYLIRVVFQFRLAYVAPKSKVVGVGYFVEDPKKIALNYLVRNFSVDFIAALPLPQIIISLIIRNYSFGGDNSNITRDLLHAAIFFQNVPRLYIFISLLAGQSSIGFIFKSAWSNFVINLLAYVLAGHLVGSYWYLFGLQRVNQCLQDACDSSGNLYCNTFISCGRRSDIEKFNNLPTWDQWKKNLNATACFWQDGFSYGIYQNAVNLTTHKSLVKKYVYSLSWGFQQITTLAGNQVSSYFEWEALFVMAITGLGLLLFALLLGNMQNCLQALGRRRLEMSLRCRDIERWMEHCCFPEELKRQVREAERSAWDATRGVEERELTKNLPSDVQRDIRDHLLKSAKKHGRVDEESCNPIEEAPNHPFGEGSSQEQRPPDSYSKKKNFAQKSRSWPYSARPPGSGQNIRQRIARQT